MVSLPLLLAFLAPTVQVTIDPSQAVGAWEPRILGGNLVGYQVGCYGDSSPMSTDRAQGMWDSTRHQPEPGMVALAKEVGMKVARYPGGCGAHTFDWKKAVGPLSKRPRQLFGLPEYLTLCAAIGADPLITIADYHGNATEAAELVEYLNSPADGKHPWAQLRAADGHPDAWKVKWFEYGNETEHGPHLDNSGASLGKAMSADEYGHNYLAYQTAMKAVDPTIRLGAVLATGFPDLTQWCRTVLKIVGPKTDFGIHHCYIPSFSGDREIPSRKLFENAWAAPDQIDRYYDSLQSEANRAGIVQGLPIAVTEFNGGFVQEKPAPYRHSLGNAIDVAEMLRVFTNPKHRIFMANFWGFPNEYWGQVRGFASNAEPLVRRPQFFPHQFFAGHMRAVMVAATVKGDSYDTPGDGGLGISPHKGQGNVFRFLGPALKLEEPWTISAVDGIEQRQTYEGLDVRFVKSQDVNYYHARKTAPALPNAWYRFTGWVKVDGLTTNNGAAFQIGDSRGWVVTKSAQVTSSVTGTHDWQKVEIDYQTLPDTTAIEIVARRLEGAGAVSGRACYRDVSIRQIEPDQLAAVPYVSATASRTTDGKTVSAILVNKRFSATRVVLSIVGKAPQSVKAWVMVGPSVESTNEAKADTVHVVPLEATISGGKITVEMPPHSMAALDFSFRPTQRGDIA